MKQIAFCSLLFLCVLAMGCVATDDRDALKTKPIELKFTAVGGAAIDLAELRGKVVLIDFRATWCGPCRGETPNIVATYNKYHNQGFEIVGISLDQDKNALLAYTKENGMTWPQYFDGNAWSNDISTSFGINAIPAMWLIDKKGMLVTTHGRDDLAGRPRSC
jgi:thiol-disulfide isomerase/thioredoxin